MMKNQIDPNENEVLIRFAKYGKWEQLNSSKVFQNITKLMDHLLEIYPTQTFITIRVDGRESTVKR